MNCDCYIQQFAMVSKSCPLPPLIIYFIIYLFISFGLGWMSAWGRQKLAKLIPGLRPWEVLSIEQAMDRITFNGEWYREPLGSYTTGPPYLRHWNDDVLVCIFIKEFGFIYYLGVCAFLFSFMCYSYDLPYQLQLFCFISFLG